MTGIRGHSLNHFTNQPPLKVELSLSFYGLMENWSTFIVVYIILFLLLSNISNKDKTK
jgi:hypothetical protein